MMHFKGTTDSKTIKHMLENEDFLIKSTAIMACEGRDVPLELIKQGLDDEYYYVIRAAAMKACKGKDVPLEFIKQGLNDTHHVVRVAAMKACNGRDVPLEFIRQGLDDEDFFVKVAAIEACEGRDVPLVTIKGWINNTHRNRYLLAKPWIFRAAAMKACKGRDDISLELIEKGLNDSFYLVKALALEACAGKDIPLKFIERGLNNNYSTVREAAMMACGGRDVPLELIERGLNDKNANVNIAAMMACRGRDIPLELIKQGLKRKEDRDFRIATLEACRGRDMPLRIIKRSLNDEDYHVRATAMEICEFNRPGSIYKKSFKPPIQVYKSCKNGVIVVAEIPKDAFVRGQPNQKCRASKAKIVDIIGTCYGEKIGVSLYSNHICYLTGDEIEIDDFDPSDGVCSTGFHFFCTIKEAEDYY